MQVVTDRMQREGEEFEKEGDAKGEEKRRRWEYTEREVKEMKGNKMR